MATSDTKMTTDMELAEEIERRLGELEITINKATNFQAFGDQFNERLWSTWQQAQVEEERCRKEFRLLTKVIAALRRRPDRFVPDENPPPRDRPPSGEMVMVPREPTDAMRAAGYQQYVSADKRGYSAWQDHLAVYRAMLSAAEAEGRKG